MSVRFVTKGLPLDDRADDITQVTYNGHPARSCSAWRQAWRSPSDPLTVRFRGGRQLALYKVVIDMRNNGRMDVEVEADSPLEAEDLAEEAMHREHPEIHFFEVLGAVPLRS